MGSHGCKPVGRRRKIPFLPAAGRRGAAGAVPPQDSREFASIRGPLLPQAAEELIDRPEEKLTAEQGRLLELLSMLLEEYEDRVHPLPKTDPGKMLAHLLMFTASPHLLVSPSPPPLSNPAGSQLQAATPRTPSPYPPLLRPHRS